jgi:hypothetical protein
MLVGELSVERWAWFIRNSTPAMARLHEYRGKAILAANGFKIPLRPSGSLPTQWFKTEQPEVHLSVANSCTLLLRILRSERLNDRFEARIAAKRIEIGV